MIAKQVAGDAPSTTPEKRALVDFIVIGAMRAGTTLLHEMMATHPDISLARMKETDFFILQKNYPRGAQWFSNQFQDEQSIRGEISPNYAKARDFSGVAERIYRHCPEVRLIYILRDPIARAISQYKHSWNMGEISQTPEQMLDTDEYLSILEASQYAHQLQEYLRYFAPEQILVLTLESLISDPKPQLDLITGHIGAPPMAVPDMTRQNANDELSRIPTPLLRLAQSPLRPLLTRAFGPRARSKLRRVLARGRPRRPPAFPPEMVARMRLDLADDVNRLRLMTGLEFAEWSL